ncbi:MAG: TA system VapC family ribonuclease toxin [Pseudomonadota bacterium]
MIVIDTNVLVYAADSHSVFHGVCRDYLDHCLDDASPTYLTRNICYEFLRVTTHPRVFVRPWSANAANSFLQSLLAVDSASVLQHTERHDALLAATLDELPDVRGNLMHDLHTAVLMREHGIRSICTRDTHFTRFPFLSVVDPLRP